MDNIIKTLSENMIKQKEINIFKYIFIWKVLKQYIYLKYKIFINL